MAVVDVKRDLPDVVVRWLGKRWMARVSGRLNRFASVSPFLEMGQRGKLVKTIMGPVFQFSWDAVALAVSKGSELLCD